MSSSCRYVSANFDKNAKYYLLNCRGPDVPVYYLRSSHNTSDGKAPRQCWASLPAIWAWSCHAPLQKYCRFAEKSHLATISFYAKVGDVPLVLDWRFLVSELRGLWANYPKILVITFEVVKINAHDHGTSTLQTDRPTYNSVAMWGFHICVITFPLTLGQRYKIYNFSWACILY